MRRTRYLKISAPAAQPARPHPGEWVGPHAQLSSTNAQKAREMIDRLHELSYCLKAVRRNREYDQLETISRAITVVANECQDDMGETALVWHLRADASRVKALSLQGEVSDGHVESVLTATINRLDRQALFLS